MEIAGFESAQYFAFVVSDLSQNQVLRLARGLAPALNETLQTTAFQGLNSHVLNALFKLRHLIPTMLTTYSMTTDEALSQRPMRGVPTILDRQTMTGTIGRDEKRCRRTQECQSDV
jgi:hypothetical protein